MLLNSEIIENAIRLFDTLSAFDAVNALCTVFQANTACIFRGHEQLQVVDLYDFSEIYYNLKAKDFKLGFYGGPPNSCVQRHGTLLTLFLDHLFYCYAMNRESTLIKALQYGEV